MESQNKHLQAPQTHTLWSPEGDSRLVWCWRKRREWDGQTQRNTSDITQNQLNCGRSLQRTHTHPLLHHCSFGAEEQQE